MIVETTYTVNASFNGVSVDLQLNIEAETYVDSDDIIDVKSMKIYSGNDNEENVIYDTSAEKKVNNDLIRDLGIICLNVDTAACAVVEAKK